MYGRHTLGNLRAFDTKRDETNAGRGEGQNRRELSTAGPTGPWDGLRNSILPENWFRQSFGGGDGSDIKGGLAVLSDQNEPVSVRPNLLTSGCAELTPLDESGGAGSP
jgi:hypothetical protein